LRPAPSPSGRLCSCRGRGTGHCGAEVRARTTDDHTARQPPRRVKGTAGRAAAERLAAGSQWEDRGLVFAQANDKPLDPSAVYKAWKALLQAASVRDARLHDARHTAASLLLLQGVPARVAMGVLGHSAISPTLNTYSHVMPKLAQDAAERMERALWGK